MEKLIWKTEKRVVKDLINYSKNPRTVSTKAMTQLKASIKKFGLVEIPVIDFDGILVAGHQRIKALILLERGDEEIDVRVPNRKLTDEEFKEYNLRSNKNAGLFDFAKIIADFEKDFLLDIGFDNRELKLDNIELELDDTDFEVEGMPIKDFEYYDYIVVVFDNFLDWTNAQQEFNLRKFNYSSIKGKTKNGLGRIIWGSELMKRLKK